MINARFDVIDDFEKTQRLPVLSAEHRPDQTSSRGGVVEFKIAELMRLTSRQAREIEHLRGKLPDAALPTEEQITSEQGLFEVCGALKHTLSEVLKECVARRLELNCEISALRAFEDSCDRLEQILSAPGFFPHPKSATRT